MYYQSLYVLNHVSIDEDSRVIVQSVSIYSNEKEAERAKRDYNNSAAMGGATSRYFVDEVFSTHLED